MSNRKAAARPHSKFPSATAPPLPAKVPARNAAGAPPPERTAEPRPKGLFVNRNAKTYAGAHLIVDLHSASRLDDADYIERTLIEAVNAAGATLLHIHLHRFSPGGGISGVAVLAESHISIHTWPEHAFAALDVFMCGQCDPRDTIAVLQRAFAPGSIDVQEFLRGAAEA